MAYLLVAIIFSAGTSLVLLAIKENSDRCHYYNGKWNKSDLLAGCIAIALGMAVRLLINALIR